MRHTHCWALAFFHSNLKDFSISLVVDPIAVLLSMFSFVDEITEIIIAW